LTAELSKGKAICHKQKRQAEFSSPFAGCPLPFPFSLLK